MTNDGDPAPDDNYDQTVPHCSECHPPSLCPYRSAKRDAVLSPLACLNTTYYMLEANGPGLLSKRELVIVDECDLIEKEMMGLVEVRISRRRASRWGIVEPRKTVAAGTRERVADDGSTYTDWEVWFGQTRERLRQAVRYYSQKRKPLKRSDRAELNALANLVDRMAEVQHSMTGNEDGPTRPDGRPLTTWVYDGDKGDITFKPVTVNEFGRNRLWRHGTNWLLMSGTIIDPIHMVESLGVPEEWNWATVSVPMTFPVENRPLRVVPVTEMSAKNKNEGWPKMADAVVKVAAKHPDERILVHGVSYALCARLVSALRDAGFGDRVVTYESGAAREQALAQYQDRPGSILVGPSMDRGVDLPGDACRVQVICKLPFPYLGDKQIAARLYGERDGQQWYAIQCIRSLVQMTGRGVRNEDDYAVTYILDKAFQTNIWKKGQRLFPPYLRAAIDWSGRM